jgi:LysM repeat protein
MSLPNPFVPAGSLSTQRWQWRQSKVRTGVFAVLGAHVVLFTGLLIQGCKTEQAQPPTSGPLTPSLFSDLPVTTKPTPTNMAAATSVPAAPAPVAAAEPATNAAPAAVAVPAVAPKAESTYVIKSGDTLSGIAKKHHTTVAALKKLNHLKSDKIIAGRTLKLPAAAGSP